MPTDKRADAAAASGRKQWHQAVPANALLFLAMFFSTWGSGVQNLSSFDLAKNFPAAATLLIIFAVLFV